MYVSFFNYLLFEFFVLNNIFMFILGKLMKEWVNVIQVKELYLLKIMGNDKRINGIEIFNNSKYISIFHKLN